MSLEITYKNCLLFMEMKPDKYYVVDPKTHRFQDYCLTAWGTRAPRTEDIVNVLNDMIKVLQSVKPIEENSLTKFYTDFISRVTENFRLELSNGLKNLERSILDQDAKLLPNIVQEYLGEDGLLANAKQFAPAPPPPPLPTFTQKAPARVVVKQQSMESLKTNSGDKTIDPLQEELRMRLEKRAHKNIDDLIAKTKSNKPQQLEECINTAITGRRKYLVDSIIQEPSDDFE